MEIKSNYIPHNFRNKYLKNVGGSYLSTVLQSTVSDEAGTKVVVIDDLETSSKDKALSANMGKYLNENKQDKYLQPIITQYFIDNKSEIWLLFLIAHSKR